MPEKCLNGIILWIHPILLLRARDLRLRGVSCQSTRRRPRNPRSPIDRQRSRTPRRQRLLSIGAMLMKQWIAGFALVAWLVTVPQAQAAGPYQFYSITPCRLIDTTNASGPYPLTIGPALQHGEVRSPTDLGSRRTALWSSVPCSRGCGERCCNVPDQ